MMLAILAGIPIKREDLLDGKRETAKCDIR